MTSTQAQQLQDLHDKIIGGIIQSFSIPVIYLSNTTNTSDWFGGATNYFTFNVSEFNTLNIGSITISSIASTNGYGAKPTVTIINGNKDGTVITTLASGTTNLTTDISLYDTITIKSAGSPAKGQTVNITDIEFIK